MLTMLLAMQAALASPRLCLPPPALSRTITPISAPPLSGKIFYYDKRWDWTRIARNHGLGIPPGRTPIATANCRSLGRTGWLTLGSSVSPVAVFVADCTAPADLALVRRRNIVAEIPWDLAATVPGMIADGWVLGTLVLQLPAPTVIGASAINGTGNLAATAASIAPIRGRTAPRPW